MPTRFKHLFQNIYRTQLQFIRCRGKINVTKPKPPHFERAIVEHVCTPYFSLEKKLQHVPNFDLCAVKKRVQIENTTFIELLGRDLLNWFNKSKLIAFFQKNYMDEEEYFDNAVLIRRKGMRLLIFGRKTAEMGLKGTIYEPVLRFFVAHTLIVVSESPDLFTLNTLLPKLQKMVLMAAVVENRLLNYDEIKKYGEISNIETARLQLVGILTNASQNFVHQLNYHQNSLMNCLTQHTLLNKK